MSVDQLRQKMAIVANQLNQARAMNNRPLIIASQQQLASIQAQIAAIQSVVSVHPVANTRIAPTGQQVSPTGEQAPPVHPDDVLYTNGSEGSYLLPVGIGVFVLLAAAGGVGYWWWKKSKEDDELEE